MNDWIWNSSGIPEGTEYEQFIAVALLTELENFKLISWWKNQKNEFPNLFKLYRQIFPSMACDVITERLFSRCRYLLNKRRASLHPDRIEAMIFV